MAHSEHIELIRSPKAAQPVANFRWNQQGHGQPGQLPRALFTAMMSSFTVMVPEWLASNCGQALYGRFSRTMFTPLISSLMLTLPLPSQSPTQLIGVAVGVGV